jgi:hypothetical protein
VGRGLDIPEPKYTASSMTAGKDQLIFMLKYGDKVKLDGEEGKVISIWMDFLNRRMAKVEFDDKAFPDYVDYEANIESKNTYGKSTSESWGTIERRYHYTRDTNKYCPRCDTPWKVTKWERCVWYDCLRCNKRKEDLI